MNSAFNQALVRGLGQYSGGGELPRAIPNGIKLTYSPPKCHKWFLAATYNSKFPNALVNGSTLNTGAVLLYYMGQAGAPPYFTYEGHTYHCYYDSKRKELVLYVCFDGMQAQKSTTGHSTYVLFPSAGGSGGTLVTTVPNPQSSPTYRKEKHATRAGLGASPAPMALIPAVALSKTSCGGTWTQILPVTASSPKPATPTQPLSSVQLAAQVANYMTYANQAAFSGTAPVVEISYAGHLYQITREGPFPGPTATPYVTMCVAPAVTFPGTQGKKVSVPLPGSSAAASVAAPAPASATPAPVGPSQQYQAPVASAPVTSSLPPAVALAAGLLGAAVVGGVAYLAFFEE